MSNAKKHRSKAFEIGDAVFTVVWISGLVVLFVQTLSLGPMARLVPLFVIAPTLALLGALLIAKIRSACNRLSATNNRENLLTLTEVKIVEQSPRYGMRQKIRGKDEAMVLAWVVTMIILINFAGFFVGVPLYAFLYLKLGSREPWWISIATSLGLLLVLYFIFCLILDFHFYPGLIWKWASM